MINKAFYVVVMGLLGSIIIHLMILFLLPNFSANNMWSLIEENTEIGVPKLIDIDIARDNQNLFLDPLFQVAACRFDLGEGVLRITASGETPLWTVSVFDTSGTVIFSANDRIANSIDVDLAVVNRSQLRLARQNTPDELARSVIASTQEDEGFALLRVFAPDPSWKSSAKAYLDSMQCEFLAF